jgi:hypothetical protein
MAVSDPSPDGNHQPIEAKIGALYYVIDDTNQSKVFQD